MVFQKKKNRCWWLTILNLVHNATKVVTSTVTVNNNIIVFIGMIQQSVCVLLIRTSLTIIVVTRL